MKIINNSGKTTYQEIGIKNYNTRSKIQKNGKTIFEMAGEKQSITKSIINIKTSKSLNLLQSENQMGENIIASMDII